MGVGREGRKIQDPAQEEPMQGVWQEDNSCPIDLQYIGLQALKCPLITSPTSVPHSTATEDFSW